MWEASGRSGHNISDVGTVVLNRGLGNIIQNNNLRDDLGAVGTVGTIFRPIHMRAYLRSLWEVAMLLMCRSPNCAHCAHCTQITA